MAEKKALAEAELLYCPTREAWRAWLAENYATSKGVWLVYYKKGSGQPRVAYDDAVEEALCFGWIDSVVRSLDERRYAQRYTPRKPGSQWSELNVSRMEQLINEGRMTEAGLAKFDAAGAAEKARARALDYDTEPSDLILALGQNQGAQKFYDQLTASQKKLFFRWINSAKRAETREKRIREAVELLAQRRKLTEK